MKSVNELLELFMRQAQLEREMKQPGRTRVIDRQELDAVKAELAAYSVAKRPDAGVHDNDRA